MSQRYLIEALLFFLLLIWCQWLISTFNADLIESIHEIKMFRAMSESILERGGETHGDRFRELSVEDDLWAAFHEPGELCPISELKEDYENCALEDVQKE